MQTMWQFTVGRFTIRARITPSDDLDLSWCETGETARNLDSGLWEAFDTRITVEFNGRVIGEDSLHGSIYADPAEFFTDHRCPDPMGRNCSAMRDARGSNVVICHYFPGMVQAAIADARAWLANARLTA